ncbi:MAG: (Fe-S)-binding protein [Elusimicrobia bacterium]|nr:(Fe-S)-binding protein [Elusimicrobiota bacterium]
MSKYEINELYDHAQGAFHLKNLLTDLGERSVYDAAAQCNRCGYCGTVCPTYMLTGRETLSARGRNQFLRMLIEGKVAGAETAAESFGTCLLCGACSSACYAKVPTPDLALEGRRSQTGYGRNFLAGVAVNLLLNNRGFFEFWLKAAFLLKKLGFAGLADLLGLYDFLGLPALSAAQGVLDRAPLKFLRDIFNQDPALNPKGKKTVSWAYFALCGPNYIFPEVGLASVALLKRFSGEGVFADNFCCGLIAYNYGRLTEAKEFAKKNILRFEELTAAFGNFTVVGDCSSCAAFMKTYEQLFTDDESWRPRAAAFAGAVKDILEVIDAEQVTARDRGAAGRTTYHDSCRACHGQDIRKEPRAVVKKLAGENFAELPESDWCCGGAGAYAFTQPALSRQILDRKVRNIASIRAATVVVGATSCLLQINAGLKEKYPSAKAVHYSVFVDGLTNPSAKAADVNPPKGRFTSPTI